MFLKNVNTAIVVVTDIDDNKERGGKDKEARKRLWISKKHKVMGKPRHKEMKRSSMARRMTVGLGFVCGGLARHR